MTAKIETMEKPYGKIPLWIYVVFFLTLVIALGSFGIAKYQQQQVENSNQTQRTSVEELQQSLLMQDDVININWLHTLNPLVKNVTGSVIWSNEAQQGIVKLYNLPILDEQQQYHLWVYDLYGENNAPVSGLVFKPDFENLIIPFTVENIVNSLLKFEIILEEEGVEGGLSLLLAQP